MNGLSRGIKRILTGKNCYKSIFKNKYFHILYDEDLNLTSIGWMCDSTSYEKLLIEKIVEDKNVCAISNTSCRVIFDNKYIVIIYDLKSEKTTFLLKGSLTQYEIEIFKKLIKE